MQNKIPIFFALRFNFCVFMLRERDFSSPPTQSRSAARSRALQIPTQAKLFACSPSTMLRERDLNPRPRGYEPRELPDCSTPLCK